MELKPLTVSEVSARLGVPVNTLRYWRGRQYGPPWYRLGRRVVYDPVELAQWLTQQKAGGGQ